MAPLKKASLVDQLYEQIKNSIITLSYPLGSKLNVNELQSRYGVSSTPLREAIARLQAEGLVTYENNVGARVITLNAKDIQDIQGLTLTLHKMAVRLAMDNGDHHIMADEMAAHVKTYLGARNAEAEIRSIVDLIGTFYRHSGNSRLDDNMKMIQGQQVLLRHIHRKYQGAKRAKLDHYARLEQAVRAGNTDLALEILNDTYQRSTEILIKAVGDLGGAAVTAVGDLNGAAARRAKAPAAPRARKNEER